MLKLDLQKLWYTTKTYAIIKQTLNDVENHLGIKSMCVKKDNIIQSRKSLQGFLLILANARLDD